LRLRFRVRRSRFSIRLRAFFGISDGVRDGAS
jgi:hypothetical protein